MVKVSMNGCKVRVQRTALFGMLVTVICAVAVIALRRTAVTAEMTFIVAACA